MITPATNAVSRQNQIQNTQKNDIVEKEFQAMLLKKIYLTSIFKPDNKDETEENDEENTSSALSSTYSEQTNDLILDVMSKQLAKEDIFGFNRHNERNKYNSK